MPDKEIRVTDDLTKALTHERPRSTGNPPVASSSTKPASGASGTSSKKRK